MMVSTQTSLTCSKSDSLLPQSLLYNIITSKLAEAFEMTNLHALLCDYSDNLSNIKREPQDPRYSFTSNFPNDPHFDLQLPSDNPQGSFSPDKYRPRKRQRLHSLRSPAPAMSLHQAVGLMPVEKINKHICKNCDKVYASAKWLSNHLEKCNKIIYKKSLTESCEELTHERSSSPFAEDSRAPARHHAAEETENKAQDFREVKKTYKFKIDNEVQNTKCIVSVRVPEKKEEIPKPEDVLKPKKKGKSTRSSPEKETPECKERNMKSIPMSEKKEGTKPEDALKPKKKGKLIRFSLEKETSDTEGSEDNQVIMCYLIDKQTEPKPIQSQTKPKPLQQESEPQLVQSQTEPKHIQQESEPQPVESVTEPKHIQQESEPQPIESVMNSSSLKIDPTAVQTLLQIDEHRMDFCENQPSPEKSDSDESYKPPSDYPEVGESSEMGVHDDFVRRSTRVRTKRVFRNKFFLERIKLAKKRKKTPLKKTKVVDSNEVEIMTGNRGRGRPKKSFVVLPTEQSSSHPIQFQIVSHAPSANAVAEHCCNFCMCRFQSLWGSRRHEYTIHGVGTPLTSDDLASRQTGTNCAVCQQKGLPCGPDSGRSGPPSPTKVDQEEESMWVCGICGENLKRKAYLIEHKAVHIADHLPVPNDKDMYTCKVCGKEFPTDISLVSHVNKKHNPSQTCSLCYKVFTSHLALNSHSCTSDVTISCRHCPKMFKSHSDHIKHVNSAHSSLTHAFDQSACRLCNYTFSSALKFKVHQSISHPSPDMTCLLCATPQGTRDLLVDHVRVFHKTLPFLCTVCEAGFQSYDTMMKHKTGHFV